MQQTNQYNMVPYISTNYIKFELTLLTKPSTYMIESILKTTLCISSTICLWSAFLLAGNWQGVKQRRWLSVVLFLWGSAWALRAFGLIFRDNTPIYSEVLPPTLILVGIIAGFTFLVWPITVLGTPKVGPRQLVLFCLPFLICAVVYFGVIGIFDLWQFDLISMGDFFAHISYFSVWFRLVMCACLIGYLVFTIKLIIRHINFYNSYVEQNCSEYEKYTINWMPKYLFGLVAISVFFFINLCFASYATFLCHNVVACIFLGWLSSKMMAYNSPYISDKAESAIPELKAYKGEDFNSRFDCYREQIEEWLRIERPYLSVDFNLKDVMSHFGLNRTYASRIFNEGFGKSFINVVRDYRIEYAKKIIANNPSIAMQEVANLCGYSTPQAFHKAFVYCNNGLTPGKFAQSCAGKI